MSDARREGSDARREGSDARREGPGVPEPATDDELPPRASAFPPHPACGIPLPPDWITLGPSAPRPDPRPGMRASTEEAVGGRLKERAEDFLVEEIPLYDPVGEGEHLYLGIQKSNMPHTEMLAVLCRHFKVDESAIGFAGMKDRVAVTQQTVSVHLPGDAGSGEKVGELRHERMAVLWAKRHQNKLRRGHLRGNRFSIRIRGVDPLAVRVVRRRMQQLEERGVPDYFGEQRFGYRANVHMLGLLYARGAWKELLDELLGARGTPFPPHQLAPREAYERGDFATAARGWGRHDPAELISLRALSRGRDLEGAVRAIPPHVKSFWMSALQGAVYNATLAARIADGNYADVLRGDVPMIAGSQSVFTIPLEISDEDLDLERARAAACTISPTGPVHGPSMPAAKGEALAYERAALATYGADESLFGPPALEFRGARRPLRIVMSNWETDAGVDEHGAFIRLAFDLPKGAFATVLCREIMG